MPDFTPVESRSALAQLRALLDGPRARWKRFRMLEVVCEECGLPVAEVMNVYPRPAILFRDRTGDPRVLALDTQHMTFSPACRCTRAAASYLEPRRLSQAVEWGDKKITVDRSS